LAKGEKVTAVFTITLNDANGGVVTEDVTLTITGTNDAPTVSGVLTSPADEGSVAYNIDLLSGATDLDGTDVLSVTSVTYSIDAGAPSVTPPTGVSLSGTALSVDPGNTAFDYLAVDESTVITVNYTISDGNGGTVTQNAIVTINGTNDKPVITAVDVKAIITEGTTLSDNGSFTFIDVDLTDRPNTTEFTKSVDALKADGATVLTLSADQKTAIENAFTITEDGTNTNDGTVTWDYAINETDLDFLAKGEEVTAIFTISVNDSKGGTDTQDISVTINGTNDAAVITTNATQSLNENSPFSIALTVDDVDATSSPTFTITGGADGGLFSIVGGNLTMAARDYETQAHTYEVEVTANDGFTDTVKTINVNLVDVDEESPSVETIVISGDGSFKIGDTPTVTITFSEKVNFDKTNATAGSGTFGDFTTSDGGKTWSAVLTPTPGVESSTNEVEVLNTYQDLVGNDGLGTTSSNYSVDTLAPFVSITDIDTDTAAADFITSDKKLIINGTYDESDTDILTVSFNGTDYTRSDAELTTSGDTWSLDLTGATEPELSDNIYTVGVTAQDLAGNTNTSSQAIKIDSATPSVSISAISSDSGDSTTDFITNDKTMVINGTYDALDTDVLTISFNGTDYTQSDAELTTSGDNWTLDVSATSPALNNGTYTIEATATDKAGNSSTNTQDVLIDVSAPATPAITEVDDDVTPLTVNVTNGGYTNDTLPTIKGTAEKDSTVKIFQDGVSHGTVMTNIDGNWSYTPAMDMLDGSTHTFKVTATDAAGNISADSPDFVLNIDTSVSAPTVTLDIDANDDAAGTYNVGNLEAITTVEYSTDSVTGAIGDGTWVTAKPDINTEGDHRIYVRQVDAAGNISAGKLLELTCGSENDDSLTTATKTTLLGRGGNDTLTGGAGDDTLYGDSGNDYLTGDNGINFLYGGSGDDTFYGGAGTDTFDGGAPNSDSDTVSYANVGAGTDITASLDSGSGGIAGEDSYSAIENLTGGAGEDTLYGDNNDNTLIGGAGNDTLLDGLAGNDSLHGGTGNDILHGQDGDDTLYGDSGDDKLYGDADTNYLYGGDGDDELYGGAGTDHFYGDDDTTHGNDNESDTVSYENDSAGISASLATRTGTAGIATGDTYSDIENLTGGSGDDFLVGDDENNVLTGGNGDDDLTGGAGNDILEGGAGGDHFSGGEGNDTVSFANSMSPVYVSLKDVNFRIFDAAGDTYDADIENLTGTAQVDWLEGNDENNKLDGGLGDDRLYGLAGDDILVVNQAEMVVDGGAGTDTVELLSSLVENTTYDLTDLAGKAASIEQLDISGSANSELKVTAADIQAMVDSGAGSTLTVFADETDTLVLESGSITSSTTVDDTTTYTIDGTEAIIEWTIVA
jgi:VCBS repeat-containing protein